MFKNKFVICENCQALKKIRYEKTGGEKDQFKKMTL
jgi:hypothetical protein